MHNHNTNTVSTEELHEQLKEDFGDSAIPEWKLRRLVVSLEQSGELDHPDGKLIRD